MPVALSHGKTTMNPISDYKDLALTNLLDVIPLINNTGERVQPALIRIYDRNSAIGDQEITDLALANLHDIIALISNTGDAVDPALLRIYERNCAVLNSEWRDILLHKLYGYYRSLYMMTVHLYWYNCNKVIWQVGFYNRLHRYLFI